MKIVVVQSKKRPAYNPEQPDPWNLDRIRAAAQMDIEATLAQVAGAAAQGADLVVTIETLNRSVLNHDMRYDLAPEAEPLDGPLIESFAGLARRYGTWIVAGLLTSREGKVFNSGVLFSRRGQIAGIFDKVHLAVSEMRVTAGSTYPVFETDFGRLGILICWDMQYPEAARVLTLAGAELIACPTWGWENIYGLSRAYENGVTIAVAMGFTAGCEFPSYCDPSCVVANTGKIVAAAPRGVAHIVAAELDIHTGPPLQYGAERFTDLKTMRDVRLSLRRPDTYGTLADSDARSIAQQSDTDFT